MDDSLLELRGSYQYATSDLLDRALAAAHDRIETSDLPVRDVNWASFFSRDGATLHIHARLPATIDRLSTFAVLQTLAQTATHGAVETRHAGKALEYYFVENVA